MKTKVAVFFGAVVLAFLVAACSNPAVEAPRGATGQIVVSIGVEGEESLEPAESLNAAARGGGPLARTVVPSGFSTSSFSKFEATFIATGGGGTNKGPVVLIDGTNAINLDVGTYKVTITGYTESEGNYVAAAEGTEENVGVTLGGSTTATVLVGPKTGGDVKGSFSYDITVTPGTASGTLTVTTVDGGTVSGGTVALTGGAKTDGTISGLDAGYYQALVSVTKGTEYAGFVEIIHIYPGLTSVLPAWTFTADHFAPVATVSIFDLTGTFDEPVTGTAPDTFFNAQQYNGVITWDPTVSGNFEARTPYTATVTLTAKPGYTFDGLAQNAFSYTGTSPTNSENSGVVEIGFAATGAGTTGTASTSYSVDTGVIAVTAVPSDKKITQGDTTKLDLTVPAGYTVTGWYIDGNIVPALGTGLSVSLNPADYSASTHNVSVFATKGGVPYSWWSTFTVEAAAGGGGGTPLGLADFIAAAVAITPNTPETPATLKLASSVDITDSTTVQTLNGALKASVLGSRYFVLDLTDYSSLKTLPGNIGGWSFNRVLGVAGIVGVTLPDSLETIAMCAFYGLGGDSSGLRSITIPAGVTSIGEDAFSSCSDLTRVTFLGGSIEFLGSSVFPNNFYASYNSQSDKAGTYLWGGASWSKE